MGMKGLLHWQPEAGALLTSQTYAEVLKVMESLTSARSGRWHVTCALHRPIIREGVSAPSADGLAARELFSVSLGDRPAHNYLVLRHGRMVVQADAAISLVMEKLQMYRHRLSVNFEGSEFSLGDFEVRIGKAVLSTSENIRGILLEVEYLAASSLKQAGGIFQEFVCLLQAVSTSTTLKGHFVPLETNYADYGLGDEYTPQHTALQYVLLSSHMMASRV
eukprot:jgi/Mesen1/8852/ME000053S08258